MVDLAKRDALIRLIRSQPEHEEGRALVTVSEFFDGDDDLGSIGCNLSNHPGLEHFQRVLSDIANRPDVEQVWMQIYDWEEGDWPFSENVLIVGKATISEVSELSASLQPSEVSALQIDWIPSRAKSLSGRSYINLWWD
jgi:hypothetical protein